MSATQARIVRRAVLAAGIALAGAASGPAQDVSYEKYRLPNGMTVILHPDRSLPLVAVNTWYRVGSKDEPPRRSGFAHLFEHLMFMGTGRVPGNRFDTIMEAGGGANNATTSSDRTNYFSWGPSTLLPTLLWLDADRLEDLARTMDQDKLDKQRDVVRNERRQSYENRPYGKAALRIQEALFPPGHPYHTPVIGSHEDLEAATVSDVKDFFATFYVPANASLVVAGDFDPATVKPLIESLFGTLPARPEPAHAAATEPARLDGLTRLTLTDKVQLPLVTMVWHSPAAYQPGDGEMILVGHLLAEGKTSRLYKRLVFDDKLASSVEAYQDPSLLGSVFRIDVLARPEADLDRVEKAIDEEVARLAADGPSAEELENRKATIELTALRRLQSLDAVADRLNEYEFFWGEPNSFRRDLERFRKATAPEVQKWALRVLDPKRRLVARVLPEAPERTASARDERPSDLKPSPFVPPAPDRFQLSNGIPVYLWHRTGLPLVSMRTLFRTGDILTVAPHAGSVALAADMLDEGAGDLDALHFGDAMQSLGARFTTGADHESLSTSLSVLKRNFDRAAALAVDALRRPRFAPQDWERVKALQLEALKEQEDQPAVVAGWAAARAYFGSGHPYAFPAGGTTKTVTALTREEVEADWRRIVRPEHLTILIAGDLGVEQAKKALEPLLGDWQAEIPSTPSLVKPPEVARHERLEVFLVDRPEAVQTVIQFQMPGPRWSDEQRTRHQLLNTLLGGSFTSRLNQNLREEHGYTYGARSRLGLTSRTGWLIASARVKADVTGPSIKEFLNEFARLAKGDVSDEEATKAREQMRTDTVQAFSELDGILAEASTRLLGGLPFESLAHDLEAAARSTTAELNALATSAVPWRQGVLVLVGDRKTVLPQLQDLVPAPVLVDALGEPVAP